MGEHVESVPAEVTEVYIAEERLDPTDRSRQEDAFTRHPW
jgi:hypothetical protein